MSSRLTTLFVDVGGVLLTNAWDHIRGIEQRDVSISITNR